VHMVTVFSEDTGMQFRIENCAAVKLQRGKVRDTERIMLPNAGVIQDVKEGSYKNLGVL